MSSDVVWCRVVIRGPDGCVLYSAVVRGPGVPTVEVVDRLARLRLELSRQGRVLTVVQACPDLADLLDLTGLTATLTA
jgi:hypothetical protein